VSAPVEIGAAGAAASSDARTNGDAGSARVAVSSRPGGNAWVRAGRACLGGHVSALREWLPQGQLLPEHVWRRRHKTIIALLWLHVLGLSVYGLLRGYGGLHVLLDAAPVALAAAAASAERAGLRVRVAAASFGLITSSAVLVHLSGGTIEAHFHFFVMIGVLTLYQDWLPFLLAIGYVVVHHGLLGVLAPESVYNHRDALANPWKWALIHGAFVLAASAAHIIAWRTSENQLRDQLTGLPSRALFLNRLSQALERLRRRPGTSVAVLFLDLDSFKVINDNLGHPSGDRLLVDVADRLRHALRRHETVARFGGDEFAILCEDIADERGAIAAAERVLEALDTPFELTHGEAFTSASIGIAMSGASERDCDDLIRDADAAMYRAKAQGGARYAIFDELTHELALRRLEDEQALRRAIERDELRVFFQPEVSLSTTEVVGMEALVRWEHPDRGLLGPGEFVALAEETGLIVPIGAWVLREACRHMQRWQAVRAPDERLTLSVNVSARQLADPALPATVAEILAETGLEACRLCLEVTETVLIEDLESSRATLCALKRLSVQIAIDDFGTGYSSLEHLRRFPVDSVKIDRSFVAGVTHSSEDDAIVSAVIGLAHALGLSVTAEGVETVEQLAALRARDCDTAQGFLFGRPGPPELVE
jgi:diguanylate cyclase (GGDEF)-like protein